MSTMLPGLAVVIVAAVFQGSFMAPMAYAKGWKWENSWAVFSILGMIVFNWAISFWTIPNLFSVYAGVGWSTVLTPILFGCIWAVGAICFGLGMAAVGLALGYAIIMGLVLSMGTFIPLIWLHPGEVPSAKGVTVILGLLISLVGIVIVSVAGFRKEREQNQGRVGRITATTSIGMAAGLVICIVGGVLSAFPNVGFALSGILIDAAQAAGASDGWEGNAVWLLLFTAGGIVNFLYCVFLMWRNGTARSYREGPVGQNLVLLAFMSIMWIGSFMLYGLGARMMGDWGSVIGWSVFIASSIATGSLWGLGQGEWRGTSPTSRRMLIGACAVLFVAIVVFGYSSTL